VKDFGIQLVLDSTAVRAYAHGSTDLGETIAEVVDEGASFGASVVAMAEAGRVGSDDDALGIRLLARHPRFAPLPAMAEDWDRLAWWSRRLGGTDRAAALVEALGCGAYVVTAEPDAYRVKGIGDLPVIGI
jgi:hypothetical protein